MDFFQLLPGCIYLKNVKDNLRLFFREDSCSHTLWRYLMALDNWKKSLLYTSLSVACYLHPKEYWQALIAGVLLDVTALMYLIRTVRTKNEKEPYRYKQLEVKWWTLSTLSSLQDRNCLLKGTLSWKISCFLVKNYTVLYDVPCAQTFLKI